MSRQAIPDSVDLSVDVAVDLTAFVDDLRVSDGTRAWVSGAGAQHGLWCLDQTSVLPLSLAVVATFSAIGRWIYFGASGGGGGGPLNFNRVDCSVNSGRVEALYESVSYLHGQTAGNVAGGFNGGGVGNKAIIGFSAADGLLLSAWNGQLSYTWKSLQVSTSPLKVYANLVVDLGPLDLGPPPPPPPVPPTPLLNPGGIKIFVIDPADGPPLLTVTNVPALPNPGPIVSTHSAGQFVQVVNNISGMLASMGPPAGAVQQLRPGLHPHLLPAGEVHSGGHGRRRHAKAPGHATYHAHLR